MEIFKLMLAGAPDREELTLEGYWNDEIWFEISQEEGIENLRIQFFLPQGTEKRICKYSVVFEQTEKAAKHLIEKDPLPPRNPGMGKFSIEKKGAKVEILYEGELWAEISDEMIEFLPHPTEKWWDFSLDEMWNAFDSVTNQ